MEITLLPTSPREKNRKTKTKPHLLPSFCRCHPHDWGTDCLSKQKWGSLQSLPEAVRDDPSGNGAKIMITPPHDWFHVNSIHTHGCAHTHTHTHTQNSSLSLTLKHTHTHTHNIYVLSTPALWRITQLISTLIIDSEFNLKVRRTVSQGTLL